MNLGETIYRLRTQRGMSQGDLAEALDVSRQSISKWENNSATPELTKLVKLAEVFGVSLDALVLGAEQPQEQAQPQDPPQTAAPRRPSGGWRAEKSPASCCCPWRSSHCWCSQSLPGRWAVSSAPCRFS